MIGWVVALILCGLGFLAYKKPAIPGALLRGIAASFSGAASALPSGKKVFWFLVVLVIIVAGLWFRGDIRGFFVGYHFMTLHELRPHAFEIISFFALVAVPCWLFYISMHKVAPRALVGTQHVVAVVAAIASTLALTCVAVMWMPDVISRIAPGDLQVHRADSVRASTAKISSCLGPSRTGLRSCNVSGEIDLSPAEGVADNGLQVCVWAPAVTASVVNIGTNQYLHLVGYGRADYRFVETPTCPSSPPV